MRDKRRTPHRAPRSGAPRAQVRIESDPRAGEKDMLAPEDRNATLLAARERARRRRVAQRNRDIQYFVLALIVMVALMVGWTFLRAQPQSMTPAQDSQSQEPSPPDVSVVAGSDADPTPLFASYRSLHLYLPVPNASLTEIAFHQASYDTALHMESLLPDADMTEAANNHGTGRTSGEAGDPVGPDVLSGTVLRMWRSNRTGPPDTAVDVGAKPGTPVFAPVTGTVVQVRPYKLYNEYDDYEVHIQPNGWDDVDVVLIHVESVCVKQGDQVIGGCTQIACVRELSDRVTPQVAAYTTDAGDHVHVQLNKIDIPGKLDTLGGS